MVEREVAVGRSRVSQAKALSRKLTPSLFLSHEGRRGERRKGSAVQWCSSIQCGTAGCGMGGVEGGSYIGRREIFASVRE